MVAKFWLRPVRLRRSGGFSRAELMRLESLVTVNVESLLERWDEFFSS